MTPFKKAKNERNFGSKNRPLSICKTKLICSIDEDGICIRDVDAVFNNGRRNENIGFAIFKSVEDRVDFIGRHLPVRQDRIDIIE